MHPPPPATHTRTLYLLFGPSWLGYSCTRRLSEVSQSSKKKKALTPVLRCKVSTLWARGGGGAGRGRGGGQPGDGGWGGQGSGGGAARGRGVGRPGVRGWGSQGSVGGAGVRGWASQGAGGRVDRDQEASPTRAPLPVCQKPKTGCTIPRQSLPPSPPHTHHPAHAGDDAQPPSPSQTLAAPGSAEGVALPSPPTHTHTSSIQLMPMMLPSTPAALCCCAKPMSIMLSSPMSTWASRRRQQVRVPGRVPGFRVYNGKTGAEIGVTFLRVQKVYWFTWPKEQSGPSP